MNKQKMVVVGSTGGAVFSKVAQHSFIKEMVLEAVSDRDCGFLSVAKSYGIPTRRIDATSGAIFSDELHETYSEEENVFFLSFYTKLFRGKFVSENRGRILNCHPSILPAFKGMKGFEDTVEYGSRFMGCTLHQVDEGMDTGRPIIQSAIPLNPTLSLQQNRHKLFLAQYYTTVQFLRWVHDGRFEFLVGAGFSVNNVKYDNSMHSPNLDEDLFELIGEANELE